MYERALYRDLVSPSTILKILPFIRRHRSTRFVGTFLAVCLPLWQFVNVPENWACVGNPWFLSLVLAWFIGDLLYPFIYYHVATEKVKDS